jgi:cytoskeletal protein RodZ
MSYRDPVDTKRLVAERLQARRRRVSLIRKRVVAAAGSTFALAWGVIFFQLVSGHDPVLASKAKATTTSSTGSSQTTASSGSSSSGATSPVTTSQS